MSREKKLREKILRKGSDKNWTFDDLCHLAESLGFQARQHATSHVIFSKDKIPEILNFQARAGKSAKPYQVKQLREVLQKYKL